MKEPIGFGQLENVADLLNCYEFRLTLEPAAAAAAAARHDAVSLAAIRQALEFMRDATNRQSHREDADFQFHLAIARAAQNSYFSTAMEALKDHIAVGMKFHGASVKRETAGLTRVFAEHEAIAEAIAAGDGAGKATHARSLDRLPRAPFSDDQIGHAPQREMPRRKPRRCTSGKARRRKRPRVDGQNILDTHIDRIVVHQAAVCMRFSRVAGQIFSSRVSCK